MERGDGETGSLVDGLPRGLHHNPERRPGSAGELEGEFRALVADEPTRPEAVAIGRPPRHEPAERVSHRWVPLPLRRALAGLAVLLVTALVPAGTTGAPIGSGPFTLSGSTEAFGVSFSRDGSLLAGMVGTDQTDTVRVENAATAQPVGQPLVEDGRARLNAVALSQDGRMVAAGDKGGNVWLWDRTTGQVSGQRLSGHTDEVYDVAFSPDGRLLASGSADGTVRLWNAASGQPVGRPLDNHAHVNTVAFSPDGRLLASGSAGGTVRLWNAADGQPVGRPFDYHGDVCTDVVALAFSPNGRIMAIAGLDGTIGLEDLTTGKSTGQLYTEPGWGPYRLAFSPDGSILAAGRESRPDGRVDLWNPDTGQLIGRVFAGYGGVVVLAFPPDGRLLVVGDIGTWTWSRRGR